MSKQSRTVTFVTFCRDQPLAAVLLVMLCAPLSVYLAAAVACYLWSLFVVPFGAPTISLLHAWGLAFAVRYIVRRNPQWLVNKPENEKSSAEHLADLLDASWHGVCRSLSFAAVAYVAVAWFGPVSL
jgi:hypothetical protein